MRSNKWSNIDALVTGFDDYEVELLKVIFDSKFMKRAKEKSMAKIQDPEEAHITTRSTHMEQAAIQIKKLANKLGLNETVSYIGMLMHDAGHTFGSHEGEQLMNIIGEIENIGFFHHSAKGVDVILSEGIIQSFVNQIPEARQNQELAKKLKEEAWYFLEFVVGHDGESTSVDNKRLSKTFNKYSSVKKGVLDKASKANRTNQYKCPTETLEAQLSKPADVLAYLKSDMLDAFSQGIMTKFSNDYLELIGETLCESYEETVMNNETINKITSKEKRIKLENDIKMQRIKKARNLINDIKIQHLREDEEDIDIECIAEVKKIIKELEQNDIFIEDIPRDKYKSVITISDKIIRDFTLRKISEGEDKNTVKSQASKISDYLVKMQKTRKRVVEDVMDKMQEALLEDYVNTTLNNWKKIESNKNLSDNERYALKKEAMNFSDKANKIIYGKNGMKALDYEDYVQYAKKTYQTDIMPKVVYRLIKKCAKVIMKTGIIRNKFYDPIVTSKISDSKLLDNMHIYDIDEEKNKKYKKKLGLMEETIRKEYHKKNNKKRYKGKKVKQKIERIQLYKDIYRNIQRQESRFARNCEDIYYAIPYTIRNNIEKAIRNDYDENQYLTEEEREKVNQIKKELNKYFKGNAKDNISKDNLEMFIDKCIDRERKKIEEKVSILMCRDYIAGMGDIRIKDLLIKTGFISKRKLDKQDIPSKNENKGVKKLYDNLQNTEEDILK